MGSSFAIVSYLLHHIIMANNLPDGRSIVFTATTKFQKFITVIKNLLGNRSEPRWRQQRQGDPSEAYLVEWRLRDRRSTLARSVSKYYGPAFFICMPIS